MSAWETPSWGRAFFQVVEHHGHRPVLGNILPAALPGEGIDVRGLRLRLRFRLGLRGQDGDGGLLRDLGRLLLGAQAQREAASAAVRKRAERRGFMAIVIPPFWFWSFPSNEGTFRRLRTAGYFARGGKVTKTPPGFAPRSTVPVLQVAAPRTPLRGTPYLKILQQFRRAKSEWQSIFPPATGPWVCKN